MLIVYQKQTGKKKTIHHTDLCQLWKLLSQNRLYQFTLNKITAEEIQRNFASNPHGCLHKCALSVCALICLSLS